TCIATQNTNPTDNIFSGLKVVDFASFVAGPGAAVILSDFDADVIKVEPPKGELWRIGNKIPPQPLANVPYMWHLNNRNKRGVAIDLKSPDAAKIVERLAKWADVGLFAAIVTALYRRERTGKGSSVTTSLLAAGVWSAGVAIQAALAGAKFAPQHDRKNPANAAMNVYKSSDNIWFVIVATPDK